MKGSSVLFTLLFAASLSWSQTTLYGRITDLYGSPMAGASVILAGTNSGDATDSTGWYRIEGIGPGSYLLQISFLGYWQKEQTLVLQSGQHKLRLDFQLEERTVRMDELVISATCAGRRTPMTFTVLNRQTLEKNNLGQDVPYLLRWTPSAVETSDAGTGIGYTGLRIRGSDPTRINVTINGIPLNDAESQIVYWVNLPDFASSTDDIQIQRGVGTSTNGAGAFGATINLNTMKWKEEPFAQVNASAGSFDTWKGNVQFGTGLIRDRFLIEGRWSRITSNGYIDRASADLSSYYLGSAYQGKKSVLRFHLFSGHEITYQAWNGVPATFIDDPDRRTFNSAGTEKEGEPYDNEVDNYRQTHYQLLYSLQPGLRWDLHAALHYTKGGGFFEQYKADQQFEDYGLDPIVLGGSQVLNSTDLIRRLWLDNDFYGTTYSLNYRSANNRLETTFGGAFNIYEGNHFGEVIWAEFSGNSKPGDRYYDNDARKRDFNGYGKVNYEWLPGFNSFLDLQFRQVDYEFLGFNDQLENIGQEVQLRFFNPKFGLLFQPNDRTDYYASFAVGSREPNRNDYIVSTPSSRPRPEKLYNTEIGFRHRGAKAALEMTVYHMHYRDQLALNGQINNVGEYTRINIDRSYRLGLELSGGWNPVERLRWDANIAVSRNKVDRFIEFVDVYDENFNWLGQNAVRRENADLPFSPSVIGASELSYSFFPAADRQDLTIALLSKYVSRQYIDISSDEANTIAPYFFSDLRMSYTWKPRWMKSIGVTLLIQNLFDARYESNAWSYRYRIGEETFLDQGFYPQAGRNVLVGWKLEF